MAEILSLHCEHSSTIIKLFDFSVTRQKYVTVDTLKELFESVDPQDIIAFIKDVNFYHRI